MHDLDRFITAQEQTYRDALRELQQGEKRSHWMWFIFPQIDGLAQSSTSKYYAIKSIDEARAYLAHPVLGARLIECMEALLAIEGRSARDILGSPDDLKLGSCATLFETVSPKGSVFTRVLEKYFNGKRDEKTLKLLQAR